jgi:hypothetical protein
VDGVPVPFAGLEAAELAAEPDAAFSVVEIGPAAEPEVSDVAALWPGTTAMVVDAALLLLAAEAEFAPPLQAEATITKETRIERYIFRKSGWRSRLGGAEYCSAFLSPVF